MVLLIQIVNKELNYPAQFLLKNSVLKIFHNKEGLQIGTFSESLLSQCIPSLTWKQPKQHVSKRTTNRGVIRRVLPAAKAAQAQIVGQVMNQRNFIDYVNGPGVSYV